MSTYRFVVLFCVVSFCVFALPAKLTSAATVETIAGDVIHGSVVSLDQHHLKIHSELLGELRIDRSSVARIVLVDVKSKRNQEVQKTSTTKVTKKPDEREFSEFSPTAMALVIEEMCESGLMDEAVGFLRRLETRKASKCLAKIEDVNLVADLADRYRDLPRKTGF